MVSGYNDKPVCINFCIHDYGLLEPSVNNFFPGICFVIQGLISSPNLGKNCLAQIIGLFLAFR